MALQRFYWLVPNSLAGCSRPGGSQMSAGRSPSGDLQTLASDLDWLREQGVDALLTLTETPLDGKTLAACGMEALHLPIEDLSPPTPEEFQRRLTEFMRQHLQNPGAVPGAAAKHDFGVAP